MIADLLTAIQIWRGKYVKEYRGFAHLQRKGNQDD